MLSTGISISEDFVGSIRLFELQLCKISQIQVEITQTLETVDLQLFTLDQTTLHQQSTDPLPLISL